MWHRSLYMLTSRIYSDDLCKLTITNTLYCLKKRYFPNSSICSKFCFPKKISTIWFQALTECFKESMISGNKGEWRILDLVNSIIKKISIETDIIESTVIELLNSWLSASINRLFVKSYAVASMSQIKSYVKEKKEPWFLFNIS